MAPKLASEYIAECLWPDVHESDLEALDQRAARQAQRFAADGQTVSYLGSLLMREDEVVLCLFRGERETVRQTAIAADIPFERILETSRAPWNLPVTESPSNQRSDQHRGNTHEASR